LLEVIKKNRQQDDFQVGIITLQSARDEKTKEGVLEILLDNLASFIFRFTLS